MKILSPCFRSIGVILLFSFFLFSNTSFSQQGWWTWMHGASTGTVAASAGNFGTQGVAAPTNDPPRAYNGADWTDLNGNFWTFGGVSPSGDALWKFDPLQICGLG